MNKYSILQVKEDTKKRIKVNASKRGKQIKDHVDELSRLPNSILEAHLKNTK